jgi:hypothetical protein
MTTVDEFIGALDSRIRRHRRRARHRLAHPGDCLRNAGRLYFCCVSLVRSAAWSTFSSDRSAAAGSGRSRSSSASRRCCGEICRLFCATA